MDSSSPGGGNVGSAAGDNNAFNEGYPKTACFKNGNKRGGINMSLLRTNYICCGYMILNNDDEMFPGLNAIFRADGIRDVEFKAVYVKLVCCVPFPACPLPPCPVSSS